MAADNVNVIAFMRGSHNDAQGYSQTQRPYGKMCGSHLKFIIYDWSLTKMALSILNKHHLSNIYFQLLVNRLLAFIIYYFFMLNLNSIIFVNINIIYMCVCMFQADTYTKKNRR
jgi:hypothetical protein